VPFFDHLLDTLTTPASFIAGTILMTSALPHPMLRWTLGILVGGGAAGLVQTSTALLRGASTAGTGGRANPVCWPPSKTRRLWAAWSSRCCCRWERQD